MRWFEFDLTDLASVLVSAAEVEKHSLRAGDLLICEGGEPGRSAVWQEADSELIYQKALHRFRSNGSVVPEFLMYYLKQSASSGALEQAFTGTTIKHLTKESLADYVAPTPPLAEQQRIVKRLGQLLNQIDSCRQRLDRIPGILDRLRQSVLGSATSGELTREWRHRRRLIQPIEAILGDVAGDFSYGSAAKSSKNGVVPVLRMGNIQNAKLDWTNLVYTSDKAEITKYRLSPGDVLFNRTNSPELVGKTAVFRGDREAVYAGYLIRVRCGELLLPEYLNYCFASPAGRQFCWEAKSDGVSQSNINASKLASFKFLLPSIEEQREIVRRVESLLQIQIKLTERAHSIVGQLDRIDSAILGKAFRGELVPQDSTDESAIKLLARIRREAEAVKIPSKPARRKRTGR